MPTYDYECRACGHEFELFQTMTAPVKKKCPDCGKLKLNRLIGTGAGIIFKGSGFYETDYRSKSYRDSAQKERDSITATKSSEDNKSKSKDKTETTSKSKDSTSTPNKSASSKDSSKNNGSSNT